jgi:hypothetical protein
MDPVDAGVGLCATCRFHRVVTGARSTFHLCERSFVDPAFPRYPPLPVRQCGGYDRVGGSDPANPSAKHSKL